MSCAVDALGPEAGPGRGGPHCPADAAGQRRGELRGLSAASFSGRGDWPCSIRIPQKTGPCRRAGRVRAAGLHFVGGRRRARRRPYLLVGWLWYLIMLLPVIGLVQVGLQARADRYTYLALTGPCLAVVWAVAEWLCSRRRAPCAHGRRPLASLATCAVLRAVRDG